MAFLDTLKEAITNKPSNLKEPKYIKKFNEDNKQINKLNELLKYAEEEQHNVIKEKIKLCTYGMYGEKNVAYELENSNMPILILHDLNLKYNNKAAQIDFIVIAQRFILIIECKNMVGDIEINSKGEFIRIFRNKIGKVYRKEGIYSPITQNERHVSLVKEILENEFRKKCNSIVTDCIVLSNEKSIVDDKNAPKDVKGKIIKHDQLINKMKSIQNSNKNGAWLPEESMYKVADILMKYNYNEYDTNSNELAEEVISRNNLNVLSDTDIYNELKSYRYNKSLEEKVKPYIIFYNSTLEEIVKTKPTTIEELMKVKGFGEIKCQRYGQEIVNIVKKYKLF